MRECNGKIKGSARRAMQMLIRRSARAARGRNRILFSAVFFGVVSLAVISGIFAGRIQAEQIRAIRQAGTAASTCLEGGNASQYERIRKLSYIHEAGRRRTVGNAKCPDKAGSVCQICALDLTAWKELTEPAYTDIEGQYPSGAQEIMLPVRALKELGISSPKPEMEISLEVEVGLFQKEQETFTLSGWYTDYTAASGTAAQGYISLEKLEDWGGSLDEDVDILILQKDSLSGRQAEEQLYRDVEMASDSQRFTGGNTASYNAVRRLAGGYGAALLAGVVILAGVFFLICNVMQISMAGDVRQMGLLHIVGMTDAQLKAFYMGQLRRPILGGALAGAGLSLLVLLTWLPGILGEKYLKDWGGAGRWMFFRPEFLVVPAVFTILTAVLAAASVILRTFRLSALEASAYTGADPGRQRENKRKRKQKSRSPRRELVFMAWQNVLRHRGRFFLTVLSLFLGMEAALCSIMMARGADYTHAIEKKPDFVVAGRSGYPAEETEGQQGTDLESDPFVTGKTTLMLLYDNDYDEFSPVSSAVKEEILSLDGVKESSVYLAEGGYLSPSFSPKALEPLNDSGDTVEELEEEYGSSGLPVEVMIGADHCTVQILSQEEIRKLADFAGKQDPGLDMESLADGTGVLLLHDHILSPAKEEQARESVGEPVRFSALWSKEEREKRLEATPEELEKMGEQPGITSEAFTLCGYMDTQAEGFPDFPRSWHGESMLYFVISEEGFEKLPTEKKTLLMELDARDGKEADVQKGIEQITAAENRRRDEAGEAGLLLIIAGDLMEEARSYIMVSNLVFGIIAAVLIFAGLLNYFNVCVTGMLSRKMEFDMMEKIGMTRRQQKGMILAEGAIYLLVTAALLLIVGSAVLAAVGAYMGGRISYFTFSWPVWQAAGMAAALAVICLGVPEVMYRQVRLKNTEYSFQ